MAAYKYETLSDDERAAMLEQRIRAFEADHYGHELNKIAVASLPDDDPGKARALEDATTAQATLERAISAAKAERDRGKGRK